MKPLRAVQRLKDPRDLWLFIQILTMLVLLPRQIRRKSMPDLLASLDPGTADESRDPKRLQKTVGFIDTLIRYRIFQRYGKCLLRSLILFRFLRRQGWPVEIHFGVKRTGPGIGFTGVKTDEVGIIGHSWLVLNGEPFLEQVDVANEYVTTYSYPASR